MPKLSLAPQISSRAAQTEKVVVKAASVQADTFSAPQESKGGRPQSRSGPSLRRPLALGALAALPARTVAAYRPEDRRKLKESVLRSVKEGEGGADVGLWLENTILRASMALEGGGVEPADGRTQEEVDVSSASSATYLLDAGTI